MHTQLRNNSSSNSRRSKQQRQCNQWPHRVPPLPAVALVAVVVAAVVVETTRWCQRCVPPARTTFKSYLVLAVAAAVMVVVEIA